MYIRALVILLGVALLRCIIYRFRPSTYGLIFGLFFLYLPLLGRMPLNIAPGVNILTIFLVALLSLRFTVDGSSLGFNGRAFRNLLLMWLAVGVFGFFTGLAGSIPSSDLFVLFKRWLDPLLFSLLALRLVRREDQRFLLACMLIGYAVVSAQGLREGLDIGHKARVAGLIGQANELGAFLAMYAPVVLASALFLTKGVVRSILFGLLALGVTTLVFTQSRASLLALPIGVIALLWMSGRSKYRFVGLLLVTTVAIFPSLLPEKATQRLETTYAEDIPGTGAQLDLSAASRVQVWQVALRIIAEHPLGIGFAQFQQEVPNYAHLAVYARDAHNYYLLVWAEFSLAGLVVLLLILSRMLANAWTLAKRAPDRFLRSLGLGLWASLIVALFVNCFGTRLQELEVSTYLWVLSTVAAQARDAVLEEDMETVPVVQPLRENAWGLRSCS